MQLQEPAAVETGGAYINAQHLERVLRTIHENVPYQNERDLDEGIRHALETVQELLRLLICAKSLSIDSLFLTKETLEDLAFAYAELVEDRQELISNILSGDSLTRRMATHSDEGPSTSQGSQTEEDPLDFFRDTYGHRLEDLIAQQGITGVGQRRAHLLAHYHHQLAQDFAKGSYVRMARKLMPQIERELSERMRPKERDALLRAAEPLFRLMLARQEEIRSIYGISRVRSDHIHRFFQDPSNRNNMLVLLFR